MSRLKTNNQADNQIIYKEVIGKLKREASKTQESEDLLKIQKYRKYLKFIDTIAAVFGVSGLIVEYYLVKTIIGQFNVLQHAKVYNNIRVQPSMFHRNTIGNFNK
jgi:hypothetical protein